MGWLVKPTTFIKDAPCHDTVPCVTIWQRDIPMEGEGIEEGVDYELPPKWGVQIYDTTAKAGNKDHLQKLARRIHEMTIDRLREDEDFIDRLDIYGLPLPEETTEKERISTCIEHQEAEIKSRKLSGSTQFYIPSTFERYGWQRRIIVMFKEEDEWEDDEGGFVAASWDYRPRPPDGDSLEGLGANAEPGAIAEDFCTGAELAEVIDEHKIKIRWFHQCPTKDGVLEKEIAEFKRLHDLGLDPPLDDPEFMRSLLE